MDSTYIPHTYIENMHYIPITTQNTDIPTVYWNTILENFERKEKNILV